MADMLAGVSLSTISTAAAPILTVGVPIVLALVAGPKVAAIVVRLIRRIV
jgi:hypothetical protein